MQRQSTVAVKGWWLHRKRDEIRNCRSKADPQNLVLIMPRRENHHNKEQNGGGMYKTTNVRYSPHWEIFKRVNFSLIQMKLANKYLLCYSYFGVANDIREMHSNISFFPL